MVIKRLDHTVPAGGCSKDILASRNQRQRFNFSFDLLRRSSTMSMTRREGRCSTLDDALVRSLSGLK